MPLFHPDYASQRAKPYAGWAQALEQMAIWVEGDAPFCHIRLVDGELNCICGFKRKKWHEHASFGDELQLSLRHILTEAAREHPHHGNLLIGGHWEGQKAHENFLQGEDLLRRIPWTPPQVFVTGLITMHSMRLLRSIITSPAKKFLVVGESVKAACVGMKAEWIRIPQTNCWLERERIAAEVAEAARFPGAILIYAGGLGIKNIIWSAWKRFPRSTHIDVGHFFDAAFGIKSRSWLESTGIRKTCFEKHYGPVIRGERPPPERLTVPAVGLLAAYDSPSGHEEKP